MITICNNIREYRNQIEDIRVELDHIRSLGGNEYIESRLTQDIKDCEFQITHLEALEVVGVN